MLICPRQYLKITLEMLLEWSCFISHPSLCFEKNRKTVLFNAKTATPLLLYSLWVHYNSIGQGVIDDHRIKEDMGISLLSNTIYTTEYSYGLFLVVYV